MWGYRIENGTFVPIASDAFTLHLIGKGGDWDWDVPAAMMDPNDTIVTHHKDTLYSEFYPLISSMVCHSLQSKGLVS